ncbi:MAG: glycosyltransferase [Caldiserica bacterium]|nr:glycosyltransferase [Caldisericota bacterium]
MKSLQVLHLHTEYGWRGGENQVYLLLKGLKEKGVKSFLISPPESTLAKRAKGLGIPVKEINFKSELDLVAISAIVRWIKEKNISLLHAHTSHAHSLAGMAGRIAGKKIVVTRRVDFPPRGMLSRWKYHRLVDIVIAISHAIENVLKNIGIPEERIRYVPSAFDPERLDHRKEASYLYNEFSLQHPIIGTIAYLTDHKGHIYLLRAIPGILKEFPQATFLVVGKGELGNYLRKEAKKLGITERVIFTGFREDIPEILSLLDIFVLPSHMGWEVSYWKRSIWGFR